MATNVFRIYRSAADIRGGAAAPAPSGGVYFAESELGAFSPDSHLVRLSSTGSIVWSKSITDAADSTAFIASNSSRLALLLQGTDAGVAMFDTGGTRLWSTRIPFTSPIYTDPSWNAPPMAVGPDNSLFVLGNGAADDEAVLAKLNASTGAITWSVNLRNTAAAGTDLSGSLVVMSTGDVVVHLRGPANYVQRLSGTDGSVVWSKSVVWPSGDAETAVGVDPSDNVYLAGRAHLSGTRVLPVVKLDSGGNVLWNRQVVHPGGLSSLALTYTWSGQLTCTTDGVYIRCAFGTTDDSFGHVFVPADGTIASGTALVATFDQVIAAGTGVKGDGGGTGTDSVFSYADKTSGGATYFDMIVVTAGYAASEDGVWGGRQRTTYAFDVASGSATISTASYTRATMPSFSAASFTPTEGTSTLLIQVFLVTTAATSIAPATAFGTPARVAGAGVVDPYTISTTFGSPARTNTVSATAVVPATAFGTPLLTPNRSVAATPVVSSLVFGLPWAERDPVPRPPTVLPTAVSTLFGEPTGRGTSAASTTGAATTAFGTPVLQLTVHPNGALFGALGTPVLRVPVRATSVASATAFGLAVRGGFGSTTASAPGTALGIPAAWAARRLFPASVTPTLFGTPSCLATTQRTRSGVFRPRWGVAQAERTAP